MSSLYDVLIINLIIKNMFKNKKIQKLAALFITLISIFWPSLSHAETHVHAADVQGNTVWTQQGSPYILEEDVYVSSNASLTINEGVEIKSKMNPGDNFPKTLFFDYGNLFVNGTKQNPVKFNISHNIYLKNSISEIKNAEFDNSTLIFTLSSSTLEYSILKNAAMAIIAFASKIDIASSTFDHNSLIINSARYNEVVDLSPYFPADFAAASKVLSAVLDKPVNDRYNVITIHNSRIVNTYQYNIINSTPNQVDARDNWWGRSIGPDPWTFMGDSVVYPWKTIDPLAVSNECCSNVLFVPGLEASRLYKDEKSILGTSTNTLWEPNTNTDITKLFMDSNGVSIDPTIYTKDIIGTALGVKNIYKTFIDSMNSLVDDQSINSWLPMPYDWRKSVDQVVDETFLNKVFNLASMSKTGKIIVIAHSNGGLVAKQLIKKLEVLGKSSIVDNIIFIAVPELGTPEAIVSMLHGYDQSIAGGFILSENNARTLSQNAPGIYSLLPSRKFFEKNPITVISDKLGPSINSFLGMKDFLLNNSFSKKSSKDSRVPLLLNANLFPLSDVLHSNLDSLKPASTTRSLSIFGWGLPTLYGIAYESDIHCNLKNKKLCPISLSTKLESSGDGTVLTKSNSGYSDEQLFFNLKQLASDNNKNISHANILESTDLIQKIKDVIKNTNQSLSPSTENPPSYERYFSETEPVDNDTYLTVKVFSPVDIHIYDKEGNHTGPIADPVSGSQVKVSENNIPGAYYRDLGSIKTIQIPYDKGYQIVFNGNDIGVFAVKADITKNDEVIASTTFADMPVTPLTNVDFIIASSTNDFASTTAMHIDMDGNGTVDIVARPNEYLNSTSTDVVKDISTYLESMRVVIKSLGLSSNDEKTWLRKIDAIEKSWNKNPKRIIERSVKKLSKEKFKRRTMTSAQKNRILSEFNTLLLNLQSE